MKKIFTWVLFFIFLGLCGSELYTNLSNQLNSSSSNAITREKSEQN